MCNWHVKQAAHTIREGGLVAYPTEAVFGLGCDPQFGPAVLRLLALKHRPVDKGVILIAAEESQLQAYLGRITKDMRSRMDATWPGPVTWLAPARSEVPQWLRGAHDTIAVRVTAHPPAAELCRCAGQAIVSTSANVSGRPPARSALQVRRLFGESIDYLLPGRVGGLAGPTEIRDLRTGEIVRAV